MYPCEYNLAFTDMIYCPYVNKGFHIWDSNCAQWQPPGTNHAKAMFDRQAYRFSMMWQHFKKILSHKDWLNNLLLPSHVMLRHFGLSDKFYKSYWEAGTVIGFMFPLHEIYPAVRKLANFIGVSRQKIVGNGRRGHDFPQWCVHIVEWLERCVESKHTSVCLKSGKVRCYYVILSQVFNPGLNKTLTDNCLQLKLARRRCVSFSAQYC